MATPDPEILAHDPLLLRIWDALGRPANCRLTGGYIRDRLLGIEGGDIDLTLPSDLDDVAGPARRLAQHLGVRAHVLGRPPHRVWRIETAKIKVELWPLGPLGLEDDILRRDFSCNALMWELPNGPLIDLVNGLDDIANRRLRALSHTNLLDDPVRLIRGPRFLAELPGFELEAESASWIRDLAPNTRGAPQERIGQEYLKILSAPGAALGLRILIDFDLLAPTAPNPEACNPVWLENNLEAAARLCGATPHPIPSAFNSYGNAARLALLLRAWGCPRADAVASYAWERNDRLSAVKAADLAEFVTAAVDSSTPDKRYFVHQTGEAFPVALAFAAAIEPQHSGWQRWWHMWESSGTDLIAPPPLLSGDEIADLIGLMPGPELGKAVKALTEAQVRGQVRSREGAKRWLMKWE